MVLHHLGMDSAAEAVYRMMLHNPSLGVIEIAASLQISEARVRSALNTLADLSLVRPAGQTGEAGLPVSPLLGLGALLAERQAQIAQQQQAIDECRAAVSRFVAECNSGDTTRAFGKTERLFGLNSVRLRLEELAVEAEFETCAFAPGGLQTPENRASSRPLTENMLRRGVKVRTLYLDSVRNDIGSREYAASLSEMGGEVRTIATLPLRMQIVDRRIALLPLHPEDSSQGAVVLTDPGPVAATYSLFETLWERATPFGSAEEEEQPISSRELAVLQLLSRGMTDEAIARKLGVSLRTERRIVTELMERFDVQTRFQLGQQAASRRILEPRFSPSEQSHGMRAAEPRSAD
jgi:DNA-binding CsgD family transcriptional regulator